MNKFTPKPWRFTKSGIIDRAEMPSPTLATINSYSIPREQHLANGFLVQAAPDMIELLQQIQCMPEDMGREGCTYGDTTQDSLSVAYGYNLALQQIQDMIKPVIEKALTITHE